MIKYFKNLFKEVETQYVYIELMIGKETISKKYICFNYYIGESSESIKNRILFGLTEERYNYCKDYLIMIFHDINGAPYDPFKNIRFEKYDCLTLVFKNV